MKTILQTGAILPLLATAAVAARPSINCQTELGTKSYAHVPTYTQTTTNPLRPTITVAVRSTVTKYAGFSYTYTKFVTKTETYTDTTETDTYSTTLTEFDVQTNTDTLTVTTTETSTDTISSTSTTEVATTPGFRNIRDTLNSDTLNRRALLRHPHGSGKGAAVRGAEAMIYPVKVDCTKTLPNTRTKTVYTTGRPFTKTVPYWAKKTTETDTITTTTTLIPEHVSVTLTYTDTSSVTTTTTTIETNTETTTSTYTSVIPGPTLYDACSPDNIWGPNFNHNGDPYYAVNVANNGPGVGSDFKKVADGASSAVECCSACQQFDTCETYIFRQRNRNCFLLYHEGATCTSQFNHPNFIFSRTGSDTGAGYVVGNGNCGYTYSGNSDGSVFSVD